MTGTTSVVRWSPDVHDTSAFPVASTRSPGAAAFVPTVIAAVEDCAAARAATTPSNVIPVVERTIRIFPCTCSQTPRGGADPEAGAPSPFDQGVK